LPSAFLLLALRQRVFPGQLDVQLKKRITALQGIRHGRGRMMCHSQGIARVTPTGSGNFQDIHYRDGRILCNSQGVALR